MRATSPCPGVGVRRLDTRLRAYRFRPYLLRQIGKPLEPMKDTLCPKILLGPTVLIAAIASVQAALILGNVAASHLDNALSLAAWHSLAASSVSLLADTDRPGTNQGVVWRRMLLPGADALEYPNPSPAAAAPKLLYARSNPASAIAYLHPRECAVESDGAGGLDDFALLAPLRRAMRTMSRSCESLKPSRPLGPTRSPSSMGGPSPP